MEFETEAQQKAYERCAGLARTVFGETLVPLDDEPCFVMAQGSAFLYAHVKPWGEDRSVLQVYAPVVFGAEMTLDLALYLLQENDSMRFGAFSVGADGTIFFNHNVVADSIDKEEFKASILAVLMGADDYDDEIVAKWGGRRASDPCPQA